MISKESAIYELNSLKDYILTSETREALDMAIDLLKEQNEGKLCHTTTLEQYKWERDIAIMQLHEIGKEFGEKMDDIKNLVEYEQQNNNSQLGHWIMERTPDGKPYCFHCSYCDDDFHNIGITSGYEYCPNCGKKMDSTHVYEIEEEEVYRKEVRE